MNSEYEKKICQALARAIAKEASKNAEKHVEFSQPSDRAKFEELVEAEAEKALSPQKPLDSEKNSTQIPHVFRAPTPEGPFHLKVSGLERAFRDSVAGKDIENSVTDNLNISVEFVRRF